MLLLNLTLFVVVAVVIIHVACCNYSWFEWYLDVAKVETSAKLEQGSAVN